MRLAKGLAPLCFLLGLYASPTPSHPNEYRPGRTTGCAGALTQTGEKELLQSLGEILEESARGKLGVGQTHEKLRQLFVEKNPDRNPQREGVIKARVFEALHAHGPQLLFPTVLRHLGGQPLRERDKHMLELFRILPGREQDYLDEVSLPFKPFYDELAKGSITLNEEGEWDFSRAKIDATRLVKNPRLNTAHILFSSPAFVRQLADPNRSEILQLGENVFLPHQKNRELQIWSRKDWDDAVRNGLERFASLVGDYKRASADSATYTNLMTGRLRGERGMDGKTPEEIEKERAFTRARITLDHLSSLGVNRELRNGLYVALLQANQGDTARLEEGIAKLEKAALAAVAAPFVPLFIFAAPFAGAAAGFSAATMTGAAASLGLAPLAFAALKSAAQSGIEASHSGKSFSCHFAENFANQGADALFVAPAFAALPSAVALTAAGAGATGGLLGLGEAAVITQTTHGALNLTVALGFVTMLAHSGSREIKDCLENLRQAKSAQDLRDSDEANRLSSLAYTKCASGGIDLAFAALGVRQSRKKPLSAPKTEEISSKPVLESRPPEAFEEPKEISQPKEAVSTPRAQLVEKNVRRIQRRYAKLAPSEEAIILGEVRSTTFRVSPEGEISHSPEEVVVRIDLVRRTGDYWVDGIERLSPNGKQVFLDSLTAFFGRAPEPPKYSGRVIDNTQPDKGPMLRAREKQRSARENEWKQEIGRTRVEKLDPETGEIALEMTEVGPDAIATTTLTFVPRLVRDSSGHVVVRWYRVGRSSAPEELQSVPKGLHQAEQHIREVHESLTKKASEPAVRDTVLRLTEIEARGKARSLREDFSLYIDGEGRLTSKELPDALEIRMRYEPEARNYKILRARDVPKKALEAFYVNAFPLVGPVRPNTN